MASRATVTQVHAQKVKADVRPVLIAGKASRAREEQQS